MWDLPWNTQTHAPSNWLCDSRHNHAHTCTGQKSKFHYFALHTHMKFGATFSERFHTNEQQRKKKIIVQELSMALCISIYCFSLAASFVRSISVKCFSWRFIYIIYYIDCMNRILLDVKCSNIKHRNRLKRTKLLHRSHRMQADWLLLLLVESDFVQFASPKISQIFHLKKPHKQPVGVQCERRTNPYVNWDFAKCVNHIYIHTS